MENIQKVWCTKALIRNSINIENIKIKYEHSWKNKEKWIKSFRFIICLGST